MISTEHIYEYIDTRLHEIAVERERLRSVVDEKRSAWRAAGYKKGKAFEELNSAIDALGRFEIEQGLHTE